MRTCRIIVDVYGAQKLFFGVCTLTSPKAALGDGGFSPKILPAAALKTNLSPLAAGTATVMSDSDRATRKATEPSCQERKEKALYIIPTQSEGSSLENDEQVYLSSTYCTVDTKKITNLVGGEGTGVPPVGEEPRQLFQHADDEETSFLLPLLLLTLSKSLEQRVGGAPEERGGQDPES